MQLPFFFHDQNAEVGNDIDLSEDTSKHVVSVLRMNEGESLHLTDGKGHLLTVALTRAHKKHATVSVIKNEIHPSPPKRIIIGISLLKNTGRFEWFLEKATEIGVSEIVPLLCERTERQHFRKERFEGVLVSALLQSRQCWLPDLSDPRKFGEYTNSIDATSTDCYIAHCDEQYKTGLASEPGIHARACILIGPEGDFTSTEILQAVNAGFKPVSLGENRLRSETAGMVAITLLNQPAKP